MKKKYFLVLLFICSVHLTKAQFKITEMKEDDQYYLERPTKGHIKEIELQTFNSGMNDTIVDTLKQPKRKIRRFSEKGNEIEQIGYVRGDTIYYETFNYLNDTTVIVNYFQPDNKLFYKSIYKYNNKGEEIESDPINFNLIEKTTYKYDERNNLIEAVSFSGGGSKSSMVIYRYNDKNQKIESTLIFSGLSFKTVFIYDSLGNLKSVTGGGFGDVINTKTFSYNNLDPYGNWRILSFISKMNSSQRPDGFIQKQIVKRIITYY